MKVKNIALLGLLLLVGIGAMAQQAPRRLDTLQRPKVGSRLEVPKDAAVRKKFERDHYRRTLGLDSARAEDLLRVQSEYKAAVARVVSDTSLSDVGKRAAIDRLIGLKNSQLERLLTPAQQLRVIPTTERRGAPGRGQ